MSTCNGGRSAARWILVSALALAVLPLPAAWAQDPEGLRALREDLDRMRARQDVLERENADLRARLEGGSAAASPKPAGMGAPESSVGLNVGGGGYYLRDSDHSFRLLGYAQLVGSVFDGRLERDDGNGDFSIRRARIDFMADFFDDYQLFVEFDGAPGGAAGSSDFALVEARLNWRLAEDALQLRLGKFTTPMSTENSRSSRSIDTVERYMALNSMFLLPALDTQFGAMVHGQVAGDQNLAYYLGVFNGNGRANDNLSDDNGRKEWIGKVMYSLPGFSAGLGLDYTSEGAQTLSLADLGFNRYVSVPVEGERVGVSADFFWERGPWSLRGEGLAYRFEGQTQDHVRMIGGFVQPAVFLYGNQSGGLQLLLRAELAQLRADTGADGDTLYALTLGTQWFLNPNVRIQLNAILHYFDGPSSLRGLHRSKALPMLLSQVQFKF